MGSGASDRSVARAESQRQGPVPARVGERARAPGRLRGGGAPRPSHPPIRQRQQRGAREREDRGRTGREAAGRGAAAAA
eukprot:3896632-Rhodomonas_salina.1